MKRPEIAAHMKRVREARAEWDLAMARFAADEEMLMGRLIREAAVEKMSAEQIADASGYSVRRVRALMRSMGLDPKRGVRLLSKLAAEALHENAALLGIEPDEIDLMSPLAYLPMGEALKNQILETKEKP